ncbi:unnamed protein product [Oikopleura dioica]|uniref:Uncharacterized protein n=1 Tax=Oikopleura dioica TaxID=34765 RepID=E4WQD0_OIKDI|nr:unnamed protein product [Oikopleura dioica]
MVLSDTGLLTHLERESLRLSKPNDAKRKGMASESSDEFPACPARYGNRQMLRSLCECN